MDRGEHVGAALDDALARFRHGERRAGGDENGLVPRGQGQVAEEVALDEHNLLVAEAHLSAGIAGHVHAAQSDAGFAAHRLLRFVNGATLGLPEGVRVGVRLRARPAH